MGKIVGWLIGAAAGVGAFIVSKNMLLKSKFLEQSDKRKLFITIIAAVIGVLVMIILGVIISKFAGGKAGEFGLLTGLFYDPNRDVEQTVGSSTTTQQAINKKQLLWELYNGKISPRVMEHMVIRANTDGLDWADINAEAAIYGRAGGWIVQDHVLDDTALVKIWPFDYNWNHVRAWCQAKAELLWNGYWPKNLKEKWSESPKWKDKGVGALTECIQKSVYQGEECKYWER